MEQSRVEPHLWSPALEDLIAFWRDVFGFEVADRFPAEGAPTWCRLALGGASVMLAAPVDPAKAPSPGARPLWEEIARRSGRPGAVVHYIPVPDVDALHARVAAAGAPILEGLWDAWWGYREFTASDHEGNLLCFFTPLDGGAGR